MQAPQMTLPKDSASPVLTVLVADQGLNQLPKTHNSPVVIDALRTVILALRRACQIGVSGSLRILTGASQGAEAAAAAIAAEEELPLHLLSSGCRCRLSGAQARAERQVWLGADSADCLSGEPDKLRNEIALGFTDVLLLVWDSASAEGLNSQGGKLLLAAVLAMKPVILVDLFGSVRILDRTTITQQRRHLLQCPQPSYQILLESFSVALDGEEIDAQMELIIGAMGVVEHPNVTEKQVPGTTHAATIHRVMMALVQGNLRKAFGAIGGQSVEAYRGPTWSQSQGLVSSTPILDQAFDRADIAATLAAAKHRSSVWISAMSATAAVFAAVAGAIGLWVGSHSAVWAIAEIFLIALVVGLLWQAKDKEWHSTWIGNRFIAEQLRYTRMGLPLLALTKSLMEPSLCVIVGSDGSRKIGVLSEDLRNLQQTVARMGLPESNQVEAYIAATAESLPRLRDCVLAVVTDQVDYHDRTHHEHHLTDHVLHTISLILFCLTGFAVVGHFFLHANWLLIFTAFFPALAAGIHGLTTTLEIARVAEQSKATAESLRHLREAVKKVLSGETSTWRQWIQLRHLTLLAAEIMSDENSQWQKLVTHQKPKLPA
jgi:hypothetical protein